MQKSKTQAHSRNNRRPQRRRERRAIHVDFLGEDLVPSAMMLSDWNNGRPASQKLVKDAAEGPQVAAGLHRPGVANLLGVM